MASDDKLLHEIADAFGIGGREPSDDMIAMMAQTFELSAEEARAIFKGYYDKHENDMPIMPTIG